MYSHTPFVLLNCTIVPIMNEVEKVVNSLVHAGAKYLSIYPASGDSTYQ